VRLCPVEINRVGYPTSRRASRRRRYRSAMRPLLAVCAAIACLFVAGPRDATPVSAAPPDGPCGPGTMPFGDLPGAALTPEVRTSKDAEPGQYVFWRGTVPTFDGMPLSVDVTVPCELTAPGPTVVMAHGFTDDKTVWEETDKSDTVDSSDRPATNNRWNNIWFASRGYVTLNYTARGWRDSCGPNTPGHSVAAPAPACAPFEFWIHLNDKRWEVRDVQWLTGALVQGGTSDPARLAITGGSYGGGPTSMGALLADRTVCGAAAVPSWLAPDPCAGVDDGDVVPWTTPDGRVPLEWAAALPLFTYGDLLNVLAPNGRVSDGWEFAPPSRSPVEPFGVPMEGTVSGLLAAASLFGSVAPEGSDPDSDLIRSTGRLVAGDPFPPDDPEVRRGGQLYRQLKSPITIEPRRRVPIFWVQGFTDALFPASEALSVMEHLRAADPRYPIKVFLGDIGHDYSAERTDEWEVVKVQMNDFLDHYLRPDRTPQEPRFDVGATVTRCLDEDRPVEYVSAPTWHDLHPRRATFTSDEARRTSTTEQGPAGIATDPISGATLPGPNSYKGCRIMRPAQTDPTTATYEFALDEDLTLMGGPVVDLSFSADAGGIPIAVRVWDVDESGSAQGLVTRGVYRAEDLSADGTSRATFQLRPQGYRFPAGHRMKVEVTGNDSPYLQASNIAVGISVERLSITIPLLGETDAQGVVIDPDAEAASATGGDNGETGGRVWLPVVAAAVLVVGGGGLFARRRSRSR
jgi:predicted acyl esterase